jgi:hypothetical protein
MRHPLRVLSLLGVVFLVAAGCATEERHTGKNHGPGFTSGDDLALSIRQPGARVTGRDADLARAEGKPVVVSQESILDR